MKEVERIGRKTKYHTRQSEKAVEMSYRLYFTNRQNKKAFLNLFLTPFHNKKTKIN
jgi:hypothetical protein